jgi:hypothetical protein
MTKTADTAAQFVRSNKSKKVTTLGLKTLYTHTYKGTVGPFAVVTRDADDYPYEVRYHETQTDAEQDLSNSFTF